MSKDASPDDPKRPLQPAAPGLPDAAWLARMVELEDRHPPISAGGFYFGIGRLASTTERSAPKVQKVGEPTTAWGSSPADGDMFDPNSGTYEAEIAALCARVQAFVQFHCQLQARDAQAAEDAVQDAFLQFTKHRESVVAFARSEAAGNADKARSMVRRWVCMAAQKALWRQRDQQRRLETDVAPTQLDSAVPPDVGASVARDEARQMVRADLAALESDQNALIRLIMEGKSHREIAAALGISENASMLRASRLRQQLRASERLQSAFDAWQESTSGNYAGEGSGPERTEVAVAWNGRVHPLQLTVHGLQWRADGYLHGTFVLPPTAELRDVTHGLARLGGRPGDDDVFAVAEPFTLLWHDGAEGRTATFATYLGPRPGNPRRVGNLPAAAVQFVLAG